MAHSGSIMVGIDKEAGADKEMQIHSGILMNIKLSKAAMGGGAFMEINCCMEVH